MRTQGKRLLYIGFIFILLFMLWTIMIINIDVKPIGPMGSCVGMAGLNIWFHDLTGINMNLYIITDWFGLIPIFFCLDFAFIGFRQMITRRSLMKVDRDIIIMGIYYIVVAAAYLLFEAIPVNYRPVLIDGNLEVSYPSSTTLLVLSVMSSLSFHTCRRTERKGAKALSNTFCFVFSLMMIIGRIISGVHWLSDIIGSVLLSYGLFCIYAATVVIYCHDKDWEA